MRGRQAFAVAQPVLTILVAVLRLLPRWICSTFFIFIRHAPTKVGLGLRYALMQRLAKRCGRTVAVFEGVYMHAIENVAIGDNVSIHEMCYIDATGGLTIGSDVSIAHAVTIMTTDREYRERGEKLRDVTIYCDPVIIEDDVWVGAGVRILAGVRIGNHSVVGAGSVVSKDVPPNSVAIGVPAEVVKKISGTK